MFHNLRGYRRRLASIRTDLEIAGSAGDPEQAKRIDELNDCLRRLTKQFDETVEAYNKRGGEGGGDSPPSPRNLPDSYSPVTQTFLKEIRRMTGIGLAAWV